MPSQEKVDKASFLSVTVDYIKQLQVQSLSPSE